MPPMLLRLLPDLPTRINERLMKLRPQQSQHYKQHMTSQYNSYKQHTAVNEEKEMCYDNLYSISQVPFCKWQDNRTLVLTQQLGVTATVGREC